MLDGLIDNLSDEGVGLTGVLLKTKVLLSSIEQTELIGWVNAELNGYPDDAEVPPYRILRAQLRGAIRCFNAQSGNHQLPTMHLSETMRENVEKIPFRESLSVIENLLARHTKSSGDDSFQFPHPMEANGILGKGLAEGWVVNSAWSAVEPSQMAAILTQVRSRLLDFLLALRSRAGENASNNAVKEKTTDMDVKGAFQGAVFRGDNVFINMGNENRIKVTNTKIDNEQSLLKALSEAGVPADEIALLKTAIAKDKRDGVPSLTRSTGAWYESLLEKAKKGAIRIGAGVVSETVAALIVAYITGAS
jgi:hypothetical protein